MSYNILYQLLIIIQIVIQNSIFFVPSNLPTITEKSNHLPPSRYDVFFLKPPSSRKNHLIVYLLPTIIYVKTQNYNANI